MKDENNDAIMTELGFRVKMYDLRVYEKKDTKKSKDVKYNVITKSIMFDNYNKHAMST